MVRVEFAMIRKKIIDDEAGFNSNYDQTNAVHDYAHEYQRISTFIKVTVTRVINHRFLSDFTVHSVCDDVG